MKTKIIEWTGAPQMDTGAPKPFIKTIGGQDLMCAYIVSQPVAEGSTNQITLVQNSLLKM